MNDFKISNLLLADLFKWGEKECFFFIDATINNNILTIDLGELGYEDIHIDSLFFKCKSYAMTKGYTIISHPRSYCSTKAISYVYKDDWQSEFEDYYIKSFEGKTEHEVVIKAAEYIVNLKNIKEDNG